MQELIQLNHLIVENKLTTSVHFSTIACYHLQSYKKNQPRMPASRKSFARVPIKRERTLARPTPSDDDGWLDKDTDVGSIDVNESMMVCRLCGECRTKSVYQLAVHLTMVSCGTAVHTIGL